MVGSLRNFDCLLCVIRLSRGVNCVYIKVCVYLVDMGECCRFAVPGKTEKGA